MEYKRDQSRHSRENPPLREDSAPAIHQELPDRARRTRNSEEISRACGRRNNRDIPK